jgi:hypothetical protein
MAIPFPVTRSPRRRMHDMRLQTFLDDSMSFMQDASMFEHGIYRNMDMVYIREFVNDICSRFEVVNGKAMLNDEFQVCSLIKGSKRTVSITKYLSRIEALFAVNSCLGYDFSDKVHTAFSLLKEAIAGKLLEDTIEIQMSYVYGDDIVAAYDKGFGQSTCMTDCASGLTRVYAKNPKQVCMLQARTPSGNARALLWTLWDGRKFLDRCYGSLAARMAIRNLAISKKNWLIRLHDGIVSTDGRSLAFSAPLVVKLETSCDCLPYMDSFRYVNHSNPKQVRRLCTHALGKKGHVWAADSCEGIVRDIDSCIVEAHVWDYRCNKEYEEMMKEYE